LITRRSIPRRPDPRRREPVERRAVRAVAVFVDGDRRFPAMPLPLTVEGRAEPSPDVVAFDRDPLEFLIFERDVRAITSAGVSEVLRQNNIMKILKLKD